MLHRILIALTMLFVAIGNIHANPFGEYPFGFQKRMSEAEAKALEGTVVDSSYEWYGRRIVTFSKVPVSHDQLASYSYNLYFNDDKLTTIIVTSDTIRIGVGGQNIMPKFIKLRDELGKHYNGYTKSCYPDGINPYETPLNWIHSVLKQTRSPHGLAFVTTYRPGFYLKHKQVREVELSIDMGDPATIRLVISLWKDTD